MKAAVYTEYGPPSVLRIQDIPEPAVKDGEVLVRVHCSAVNRTDCGFLRAKPFVVRLFAGLRRPKYQVLGSEFAGEVVELGPNVNEFAVGDKVFGYKDDDFGFGGLAEFTAMPVKGMVTKIPEDFSYREAAAATEGAHYALHYIRASKLGANSDVLINGSTGAIGSSAVQIIKSLGASVVAVCPTEHMQTVRNLGADDVIDYTATDFTSDRRKFDVVFDAVGKSTFGQCRRLLTETGVYLSTELGPYLQNLYLPLWTRLFGRQRALFPLPSNRKSDIELLARLMADGEYRPLIDRVYPLSEISLAFAYVETGTKLGNVVIEVPQ